jgi:hypothetical protein
MSAKSILYLNLNDLSLFEKFSLPSFMTCKISLALFYPGLHSRNADKYRAGNRGEAYS